MSDKFNKTLEELLPEMRKGAKVAHYDWDLDEHITIKDGEFCNEAGNLFTLSPWMLDDSMFGVVGECPDCNNVDCLCDEHDPEMGEIDKIKDEGIL